MKRIRFVFLLSLLIAGCTGNPDSQECWDVSTIVRETFGKPSTSIFVRAKGHEFEIAPDTLTSAYHIKHSPKCCNPGADPLKVEEEKE